MFQGGTYYNHTLRGKHGETQNAIRRRELFPIIEEIYHDSNQIYGAGKIAAIMRERGISSVKVQSQVLCTSTVCSVSEAVQRLCITETKNARRIF